MMMKITAPAIPPAMYANSDFSWQCLPVKLPIHRQDGSPLVSLTQAPSLSQYPVHTSENNNNNNNNNNNMSH